MEITSGSRTAIQAWAFPLMCQDETRVISGTERAGVALTSGALFGMVAQAALRYVGFDLATIHGDLIVGGAARPGLAAWVWWFLAIAVFFVGPLGVALARRFIADRRLFRGWRLLAWVAIVLGLMTLVHLAPASLGMTRAPAGFPVVVLSALLAAIGARLARPADRSSGPQTDRASGPFPISRPGQGGSVNSGLPMRRVRRVRSTVLSGVRLVTNVALAVLVPMVTLAAVSALSGAVVVHELAVPGAIRAPVVKEALRQAPRIEVLALADEPAGADPRAAVAAIRAEPVRAAPPPPVPKPAVRMTAPANKRVPMSASELTFAKGYAKRHAALQAAKSAQAAAPEVGVPAKQASRTAALAERYDRSHRRGAHARHGGYQRVAAYHRHAGASRRYTDGSGRYAGYSRQRGGYEHYAHYDDWRW